MSVDQSMTDDLNMMKFEEDRQNQFVKPIEEKAATTQRRQSNAGLEFDRALIFVRTIHVRVSTLKFFYDNIKHHKHEYLN